jgi:ATP-dependent Clp protease ATP-binding subunit ClpA
MTNSNNLSRMPKTDNGKSKRKSSPKRVLKRGGKGGKDDDDSSVDSKGNIRGLIDYDYTSDSESESSVSTPSRTRSPRTPRKAAVAARKKIAKAVAKDDKREARQSPKPSPRETPKETQKKNKIIYKKETKPKEVKRLTPSKRRYPFKDYKKPNVKRRSPSYSRSSEESAFPYEDEDDSDEDEDEMEDYEGRETEEEVEESEEEEEDDDEDDDEDEDEDEDDDEDEDEDEEETGNKGFGGILLALGGGGAANPMKPKKYNMKKEPESVKKFVKLLTEPVEENTIDKQIDQFKALADEKQKELITALENRPTTSDTGVNLMLKILTLKLPPDVQGMILSKYNSLQSLDTSSNEYFKLRAWLDKVVSIPFGIYKDIPARLEDGQEKCGEFMKGAKKCLDDAVYGQDESKLQIMQFISTKIANPESRGLSLLLIGPPGIGKTSLIKNGIAKALNWPFQFISLGGDSDASTYTGHQLVYESSHCGKIVNSLIASKSMSTVLMFDEVDKISQTPKGEEVMNLLIHLTDPVQNGDFEDKYLSGVPIDLSKVMFVFSANDINKIDKVLLDRMMVIDLKGYDLKQKTTIAEQYLLPAAVKEVNLTERISISKDILTNIIEEYANEEKGVRELKRCIEQITQKINMLRMYNSPELPFHIKDFSLPFIVKKDHVKLFIKKKENRDAPPMGMYL